MSEVIIALCDLIHITDPNVARTELSREENLLIFQQEVAALRYENIYKSRLVSPTDLNLVLYLTILTLRIYVAIQLTLLLLLPIYIRRTYFNMSIRIHL